MLFFFDITLFSHPVEAEETALFSCVLEQSLGLREESLSGQPHEDKARKPKEERCRVSVGKKDWCDNRLKASGCGMLPP